MSNVIVDGKDTFTVTDYFGGCPECGRSDWLNVGRNHIVCCHEHKLGQCIGSKLFSNWKDETEEVWKRNQKILEGYSEVEFLPEGTWSRDLDKRKLEMEAFERKQREDRVIGSASVLMVVDDAELPF
jgi:hypothetical protein